MGRQRPKLRLSKPKPRKKACSRLILSKSVLRTTSRQVQLDQIVREFDRLGVLLLSDSKFPSFVSLAARRPIRGSWWGIPEGRSVFRLLKEFTSRKEVLTSKLISGKVTFVHRRLWKDILAIGTPRSRWQMDGLSQTSARLLYLVDARGQVTTSEGRDLLGTPVAKEAHDLERRMLVQSEEFHTTSGFHETRLKDWGRWSSERGISADGIQETLAKSNLEGVVARVNEEFDSAGTLPWSTLRSKAMKRTV